MLKASWLVRSSFWSCSEKVALAGPIGFPLLTRGVHCWHLTDFGDRHVPPAFVARHLVHSIVLDVDDRRARPRSGCLQRSRKIGIPLSLIHISEPTRLGMISYAVFCLK